MWARNGQWILPEMPDFHLAFRGLLHAVNLQHGTDGFTSPPKEGMLKIFSPWKIRQLWLGLNPRTWVPKASTLPLDHRRRLHYTLFSVKSPKLHSYRSLFISFTDPEVMFEQGIHDSSNTKRWFHHIGYYFLDMDGFLVSFNGHHFRSQLELWTSKDDDINTE